MGLLNEKIMPLGYESSALANYQPSQNNRAEESGVLDSIMPFIPGIGAFYLAGKEYNKSRKNQAQAAQDTQGMNYQQLAEYWAQRGDVEKARQYAELDANQNRQARAFSKVEGVINPQTGKKDVAVIDEYGVPKYVGLDLSNMQTAEAPRSREINVGDKIVTQEWNGTKWVDVASAPRYKPSSGGGGMKAPSLSDTLSLNQKFTTETKDYATRADSYRGAQASASLGTPQGDYSLIYQYNKMLDPGSVVREGEFANAAAQGGVEQRALAYYNKLKGNGMLTPAQRADILKSMGQIVQTSQKQFGAVRNKYSGIASRYGINPDEVVQDYFAGIQAPQASSSGMPTPDQIAAEQARRAKLRGGK